MDQTIEKEPSRLMMVMEVDLLFKESYFVDYMQKTSWSH
jgi:hypothetical protein